MPLEYKISAVMAMTRYYKSYPVRKTDSFGALLSPPVISICDVPFTSYRESRPVFLRFAADRRHTANQCKCLCPANDSKLCACCVGVVCVIVN